ncbi:MAG: DUF1501 domain-containing protein [Planctomycetaceae bacterium]
MLVLKHLRIDHGVDGGHVGTHHLLTVALGMWSRELFLNEGRRMGPVDETRREFLSWVRGGLMAAAVSTLAARDRPASGREVAGESADLPPHFPARAKRAIHICMTGGVSQVDSFDYKPALEGLHGKSLSSDEKPDVFFGKVGLLRKSDWTFRQRGESGLWVSDLFPHIANVADELLVIRSMQAETSNHTPATFQENTGFRLNGFPVLGAWLSYGLGAETDNLPSFVVIPDQRGVPAGGSINWSNGFLPARHQGCVIRSQGEPIDDLFPAQPRTVEQETAGRQLLSRLNERHLESRGGEDLLASRIRSYELAAKMQLAVPEAAAIESETQETLRQYGVGGKLTNDFGRSCLMARRLLERGVRFVQLFAGGAFGSPRINWDGHENVAENHGREAARMDQPVAALIADLRTRGLLDDTLVLLTSEFGRTPFTQSGGNELGTGRDHNQNGFSVCMAGAGLRTGRTIGATDDIGWKAVEEVVPWHDFHATTLHLLGINHERLTFYHNGIQRRLTNVHGEVLSSIVD